MAAAAPTGIEYHHTEAAAAAAAGGGEEPFGPSQLFLAPHLFFSILFFLKACSSPKRSCWMGAPDNRCCGGEVSSRQASRLSPDHMELGRPRRALLRLVLLHPQDLGGCLDPSLPLSPCALGFR